MLNGHIDCCEGRNILGWAIPSEDRPHCEITVADPAGNIVAGVVASSPRSDLFSLGAGRTDFAFRIGVPDVDQPGPVRIFADGVEMPGSPVLLGPDRFDGHMTIADGRVSGWVSSRDRMSITTPVQLYDQDGERVATLATTLSPNKDDSFFRPALFSAPLPQACFGRDELLLTAKAGDTVFATATGAARLNGYLDALSAKTCGGWVFSPDAPERRLEVAVYRDGVMIGSATTALERDDVRSLYPGVGRCGFEVALEPDRRATDSVAHISIRLTGSSHELFGGPFLMGTRAQIMQDAYEALLAAIPGIAMRGGAGSGVLRAGYNEWLHSMRGGSGEVRIKTQPLLTASAPARRLTIVIPVHSDVGATRTCLESVLRDRCEDRDAIVIVNDNPGDAAIETLVSAQAAHPNVFVLRNPTNAGFVGSVNRAMEFVRRGDVLLLNSDTELFAGTINELHAMLHASPEIGTVTAISNNATQFSYPHPTMTDSDIDDIGWPELAAVALRENAGKTVTIPTAHGFCMLIRRAVLDEIGLFDPIFGRGYGEENDFSLRASDRGWRHVAAGGALVRHLEAASFGAEKPALVAANLSILSERFPEYRERIDRFAKADEMRRLRWALDFHRLRRLKATGIRLDLTIGNWMDGGTELAARDIESVVRNPKVRTLRLTAQKDGSLRLLVDGLRMLAVFQPDDTAELFRQLTNLAPERVIVHHLLGFDEAFVRALRDLIGERQSIFHLHDFYYACPRVTLIDASGGFCGGAAAERCGRCVALAGSHVAYRMDQMSVASHRALFQDILAGATHLIAPSDDTAARVSAMMPGLKPAAVPHPQYGKSFPIGLRRGTSHDICLLGALGPHKGSHTLRNLARHAWLNCPDIRFHVIGFTDIDKELSEVGNVTISGKYDRDDLPALVDATRARIALFLHGWPETFCYTLSEAVSLGMIPVVPDIGAPAERVRGAGFGVIYPFPIDVDQVLQVLIGVASGAIDYSPEGALPLNFDTSASHERLRALYLAGPSAEPDTGVGQAPVVARPKRRNVGRT